MTLKVAIDKILKLKKSKKNSKKLYNLDLFDKVISQPVTYNSYFNQPSRESRRFQKQLSSRTRPNLRTTSVYT